MAGKAQKWQVLKNPWFWRKYFGKQLDWFRGACTGGLNALVFSETLPVTCNEYQDLPFKHKYDRDLNHASIYCLKNSLWDQKKPEQVNCSINTSVPCNCMMPWCLKCLLNTNAFLLFYRNFSRWLSCKFFVKCCSIHFWIRNKHKKHKQIRPFSPSVSPHRTGVTGYLSCTKASSCLYFFKVMNVQLSSLCTDLF